MKNSILYIFITLGWMFTSQAQAQEAFIPQNMGEFVNSRYSEINPVISPDGSTLYFVRVNHPANNYGEENSQDIWFTKKNEDGTWAEATRLSDSINIARFNSILSISADGHTALINGVFDKKGTIWKKRGISMIKKTPNGWSKPEPIKINGYEKANKGMLSDAFLSFDGSILVLSFGKSYNSQRNDLYISFKKDQWEYSRPKRIKALKTKFNETAPFLSSDNKVLYFASNRRGALNYDIYRTERLDHDWEEWSTPELINDTINSLRYESFYKTNEKGSMAYYSSGHESIGKADIFQMKIFEENPYVVVSGRIINKTNDQPLPPGSDFLITANGAPIDSLIVDHQTSSYQAVMRLGNSYSLKAELKNHRGKNEIINTSDWHEYREIEQDLMVEPLNYISISGALILKSTNEMIPARANPQILVNGQKVDSLEINPEQGTYHVKLPFGKMYKFLVNTTQYEAIPEMLNAANISEFTEIVQNLYVDVQKTAIITGKILDDKTQKPFPKDIPVVINIDDEEVKQVKIDSLSRNYMLELGLGRSYLINAMADNYYPMFETIDLTNEKDRIRVYKDLTLIPIEIGTSVRLNNIFFETGKATLKAESFEELDRVVKFLNDYPAIQVEIGGHTDNVGKAAYNLQLSKQRAQSVAEYIMSKGLPASAITYKGYGLTNPVADNKTPMGRQLNRRVEFTIIGK
ncbi:MAG: OmpA family protein [Candidatus Cyclobacteriaceae bacterium M3_2C_046]